MDNLFSIILLLLIGSYPLILLWKNWRVGFKNKPKEIQNPEDIGPLDIFKIGFKDYFKEFSKQLGEFTTPPSQVRKIKEIFKEDLGPWSTFFTLSMCSILVFLIWLFS